MGWGIFGSIGNMVSDAVSYVGGKIFGDGTYKGGNDNYRDSDRDNYRSGGGSSSNTLYEPDKVKVAEIESAAKLKLAGAENDRIVLWKETQMELAEFNAKMEAAMIEVRARGFDAMQQALMGMLKEVNVVAEERLVLIENASIAQIKQVENLYAELDRDIKNDNFMTEKVPQLMQILREFPEGSDMRDSYRKGIDLEIAAQIQFKAQQIQQLETRRKSVLDSVAASKQLIHQHINEVVSLRVQHMEQVMLEYKQPIMPALEGVPQPSIQAAKPSLNLSDESKANQ